MPVIETGHTLIARHVLPAGDLPALNMGVMMYLILGVATGKFLQASNCNLLTTGTKGKPNLPVDGIKISSFFVSCRLEDHIVDILCGTSEDERLHDGDSLMQVSKLCILLYLQERQTGKISCDICEPCVGQHNQIVL